MARVAARRQKGAVSVIVAATIFTLIAVLGLLIDLGHLYVVKNELQNAADSCALAAARELMDLSAGATNRAKAAGVTAARANRFDLQSRDIVIDPVAVTFNSVLDPDPAAWSQTVDANTVYARCAPYEAVPYSVVNWIGHITADTPQAWDLYAVAVARPVGGQTYCAIPLAMCVKEGPGDLVKGQWYSGRMGAGSATTGNYDWVRLGGSGASSLADLVAGPGECSMSAKVVDSQGGVAQGVAQAWNTRFGLYSGSYNDPEKYPYDRVGYAFTKDRLNSKGETIPGSWPYLITNPPAPLSAASTAYPPRVSATDPQHAYDGTTFTAPANSLWHDGTDASYSDRESGTDPLKLPYDPNALLDDNGKPMRLPGSPAPLSPTAHQTGQHRRMVFMPVIKCGEWESHKQNIEIKDWACAFMLTPLNDPNKDVQLEFRGLRSNSDCGTTGIPGDIGPPVPALVQ